MNVIRCALILIFLICPAHFSGTVPIKYTRFSREGSFHPSFHAICQAKIKKQVQNNNHAADMSVKCETWAAIKAD